MIECWALLLDSKAESGSLLILILRAPSEASCQFFHYVLGSSIIDLFSSVGTLLCSFRAIPHKRTSYSLPPFPLWNYQATS